MTTDAWIRQSTNMLESKGISTARLDSIVLLEDCLELDRAQILAEPGLELSSVQATKLKKLLIRRAKHEPLAYIRGFSEFYGRKFVVTPAVLNPRSESEAIIDLLGELSASGELAEIGSKNGGQTHKPLKIADVGAGSGTLGITAKLEVPPGLKVAVDLLEIDPKAAKIAKINVDKYTTSINVIISDLLSGTAASYDVLMCNLPYVPDGYAINQAASFEPALALYGGKDGLDLYRRLFEQLSKRQNKPLYLLIESLPLQHAELELIASKSSYTLYKTNDFVQAFVLSDK